MSEANQWDTSKNSQHQGLEVYIHVYIYIFDQIDLFYNISDFISQQ